MSFKQEKVIVIISEFVNDKREFYPITNVPVEKARFFYKDDDGLFKVMASSDYAVRTELNETRLYITNVEIKEKSTKFQVGYEINFTSSEYETSLPVLSVLVEMYNNLIEDSRTIFNYVKKQCFISDDKTTSLVLPNLPSYTVWCMGENGEMFALPVSELYSKFQKLVDTLYKEIKKLLDVDYANLSDNLKKELAKHLLTLEEALGKHKDSLDDYTLEKIEEIKATCDRIIGLAFSKLTKADTIEDLKTMRFLKVGDIVEVLGYYTAGDGANHKRIIANEDDGSGVQLANGLWANIVHNGEVNVSWFGAKGDGVSDDTEAIQKALDYCDNVNLCGRFVITQPILVKIKQNLNGKNLKTQIILKTSSKLNYNIDNIDLKTISDDDLKKISACLIVKGGYSIDIPMYINIKNIAFENHSENTVKGKYGILVVYAVYSTFKNININGFEQGFRTLEGWNNIISNMRIGRANYGILFQNNNEQYPDMTSWVIEKAYTDYCDIGYEFYNLIYSNLSSVACDHTKEVCYSFKLCGGVSVNGMGAEMSNAQIIRSTNSTISISALKLTAISDRTEKPVNSLSTAMFEINSNDRIDCGVTINGLDSRENYNEFQRKFCYVSGGGRLEVKNAMLNYFKGDKTNFIKNHTTVISNGILSLNENVMLKTIQVDSINDLKQGKTYNFYAEGAYRAKVAPYFLLNNSKSNTKKTEIKIPLLELYKAFDFKYNDIYLQLPLKFYVQSSSSKIGNVVWVNPDLFIDNAFSKNNLQITSISVTETDLVITMNTEVSNELVYITLA